MPSFQHNFSLKGYNSFGVEARASLFAAPENETQLKKLLEQYDSGNLPLLVMGSGTNILFQRDFEGLVLQPRIKGIRLVKKKKDHVVVSVGAGENWDSWVERSIRSGWYGLENLSLIPGSVGAAPVQNIGAYGVELKDHFAWLDAWDLKTRKQVRLNGEACGFGYRSSIFKSHDRQRYIILHVAFHLRNEAKLKLDYGPVGEAFSAARGSSPMDLRNVITGIRKAKLPDPDQFSNAGSFFKNPHVDMTIFKCIRVEYPDIPEFRDTDNQVKIPAAWLIEAAGWKGKRLGNVGTWPTQPLVVVNYGGATGTEILEFSERIREAVDRKFGIHLEREVNVI